MIFYCNNKICDIHKTKAVFTKKISCPACNTILQPDNAKEIIKKKVGSQEQMLANAEKAANVGSWEWDIITDNVIWSAELYRIFGLDPEDDIPPFSEFHNFYHPDDLIVLKEKVQNTITNQEPYEVEVRIFRPNGEMRYGLGRGLAKLNENDEVIGLYGSHQDITDKKLAELQLIESEERLELALNTANLGCFEWRPMDGLLHWDERMHEIFDIDINSEMDRNEYFASVLHPDDKERIMTLFMESLSPTNPQVNFANKFKILLKNGQVKHIFSRSIHFKNEKGEVIRLIGTSLDITERMQAEEALENLAHTFNVFTEEELFIKVCEYLTSTLNTDIAFVGELSEDRDELKVLTGIVKGEVLPSFKYNLEGTPCHEIIKQGTCAFQKDVQKLFPSDEKLKQFNIEGYVATPLIRQDNKTVGIIGVLHTETIKNVTVAESVLNVFKERLSSELSKMTAEESLKASEARYKSLTESATVGIAVHTKGVVSYVNPFGIKLFDSPNESTIIGSKLSSFIVEEFIQSVNERVQNLYLRKIPYAEPSTIKVKTHLGNIKEFLISGILIEYDGEPSICNVFTDISEIKEVQRQHLQAKEELAKLNSELEERVNERTLELLKINTELREQKSQLQITLDELRDTQQQLVQTEKMASLGTLTAGVAHELNNPLNFISSGAQGLDKYIDQHLPEHNKIQKMVKIILNGVWRAKEIVQSLNHFSRSSDNTNQQCDIHTVIENCLTMLQNQTKHRINIDTNFTNESYQVIGNESKLHQVFINVIANSVQAIKEKGSIDISTDVNSKSFITTIRDNGEGISQENISRIMDPFFTTKPPGKGTGLGMSIAYDIVQLHKGSIKYNSVIGKGTQVEIHLPLSFN